MKKKKKKPDWDFSVTDLSRYKLSTMEEMRKKQNYHLLGIERGRTTKKKKKKKRTTKEKDREEKDVTSLDLLLSEAPIGGKGRACEEGRARGKALGDYGKGRACEEGRARGKALGDYGKGRACEEGRARGKALGGEGGEMQPPFVTSIRPPSLQSRGGGASDVDFEKEIEDFVRSKRRQAKKKLSRDSETDGREKAEEEGNKEKEGESTDSKLFQEMADLLREDEENRSSRLVDCDVSSIEDDSSVTSSVRLLREVDDIINEEEEEEEAVVVTQLRRPGVPNEETAAADFASIPSAREDEDADLDHLVRSLETRLDASMRLRCHSEQEAIGAASGAAAVSASIPPARDETVLSHLVSSLETRLASISPPNARTTSSTDPDPVPRLLRVCDGLVQNLTKTTLMQKHQQEILLKVQLEADRWKREYEGLARDVDSMQDSLDTRILTLEERAVIGNSSGGPEDENGCAFVDDSACAPMEMMPSVVLENDIIEDEEAPPKPRTIRLIPKPMVSPQSFTTFASRSTNRRAVFHSPADLSFARATETNAVSSRRISSRRIDNISARKTKGKVVREGVMPVRNVKGQGKGGGLTKPTLVEKEKSRRAHRAIFFDVPPPLTSRSVKKKADVFDVETRVAIDRPLVPFRKKKAASPSTFRPVLLL
eukprot:g3002.t1